MKKVRGKIIPRWNHWQFYVDLAAPAPDKTLRRFAKPQIEFDIAFCEDVLADNPRHLDALRALAELYTRNGQCREGLRIDRQVVAACPRDPVAHYNLACSLSLTNRVEECFKVLRRAIRLGYRDFEHITNDPDLEAARADRRWAELFSFIQV